MSSATSIGLFEQTNAGLRRDLVRPGRPKTMSRVTTAEGVLEASIRWPALRRRRKTTKKMFRGHPLAVPPTAPVPSSMASGRG